MTNIAYYINEMKRKHEHSVRVQEIQSLLYNWEVSFHEKVEQLTITQLYNNNNNNNNFDMNVYLYFLFESLILGAGSNNLR